MSKEQLTLEEMLEKWPELGDPEIPQQQVEVRVTPLAQEVKEQKLLLCADCHWVSAPHNRDVNNYRCFAPQNFEKIHPVDGSRMYFYTFCKDSRMAEYTTAPTCGMEGKWWKELIKQAVISAHIIEEPTIGGKAGTNLELVSDNSVKKYKVPKLTRLSKQDLDGI